MQTIHALNENQFAACVKFLSSLPEKFFGGTPNDRIDPNFDLDTFVPEEEDVTKISHVANSITRTRRTISDKPVFGWVPDAVSKKVWHLETLRDDMAQQGHMSPAALTLYAEKVYGNLIPELKAMSGLADPLWLLQDPVIDWEFCDALTERGFTVTFDRQSRVLAIAIGASALVLRA